MPIVDRVVRRTVRPTLRRSLLDTSSLSSFENGIHLDFTTGTFYTKIAGQDPIVYPTLQSMFTFTGGAESMYMGPAGLLVHSITNTPRIEYDASGNCLGLLMEASRTNLCLQSQDLTTTWVDVNTVVITANSTTAPDGTLTADTITDNGAGSIKGKEQTFVVANDSLDHTGSVFILKTSGGTSTTSKLSLLLSGGTPVTTDVYFNTDTGVVGAGTATVTSYGLYWRLSAKVTNNTTGNTTLRFQYYPAVNTHGLYTDSIAAQGSAIVWGFQLEKASFASSYIPTTTTSVARTADSCIRTLSTEFSATAGTVVVNVADFISADVTANNCIASLDDATANERFTLQRTNTAGAMRLNVFDGGVNQAAVDGLSAISTAGVRLAYAYAANDFAISGNGGAVVTDGAGTLPTVTRLDLGSRLTGEHLFGHIRRFDYYPKRESNDFLQRASA